MEVSPEFEELAGQLQTVIAAQPAPTPEQLQTIQTLSVELYLACVRTGLPPCLMLLALVATANGCAKALVAIFGQKGEEQSLTE